jgi:hypothetical protein
MKSLIKCEVLQQNRIRSEDIRTQCKHSHRTKKLKRRSEKWKENLQGMDGTRCPIQDMAYKVYGKRNVRRQR